MPKEVRGREGGGVGTESRRVVADPGSGPERLAWWVLPASLFVLHLILAFLTFDPTPHTGGDNAAYISLARSLLEEGSYRELYAPATPPHTQYPPAFPGILALATLLGLGSWVGLKWVVAVFSGVAVGATYLLLRRRSGPGVALGVSLVVAASPLVLDLAHWVLSDVPFWALTTVALWAYGSLEEEGGGGRSSRVMVAVAVGGTVLAYFTRSAGLPLVVAAGGWLAWRRRWRELGLLGAVLGPLALLWWLRARSLGGVDYVNQFWWVDPYNPELGRIGVAEFFERVVTNGRRYLTVHLPLLLVGRVSGAAVWLSVATSLAALVGWGARLRRAGVTELFFVLYLGLILVWPAVWSGERFLLPAYPLLLGYAGGLLAQVVRRYREGWSLPVGAAVVVLLLLLSAPTLADAMRYSTVCVTRYRAGDSYPCLDPASRDFFGVADWARAELPEDAVVISRKPRLFYGLSDRRGLIYPLSTDPEAFFAVVRESGARYLVLDQLTALTARYVGPIVEARPGAFCFLHATEAGHAAVLGILPESEWRGGAEPGDSAGVQGFAVCPASYLREGREE